MAKKRATAKRRTVSRRRRSVGAINKSLLMDVAGTVGGLVAGNMLQKAIAPTMDAKIKGAATAAIGIFVVPMFLKNSFGKALGTGLAASGALQVLTGFGVLNGIGVRQLNYPDQRLLAGNGINQMVAGNGISQMVAGKKTGIMNSRYKYGG